MFIFNCIVNLHTGIIIYINYIFLDKKELKILIVKNIIFINKNKLLILYFLYYIHIGTIKIF